MIMMNLLKVVSIAVLTSWLSLNQAKATTSEMKDYNYICIHIKKPEALVFKTSFPNKAWRTIVKSDGTIKEGKAFELSNLKLNGAAINIDGRVASFKANLAKDYEIKGLFQKQTDQDIKLSVITSFTIENNLKRDTYNCLQEKSDAPPILLGSNEK